MRINNNISALNTYRQYNTNTQQQPASPWRNCPLDFASTVQPMTRPVFPSLRR